MRSAYLCVFLAILGITSALGPNLVCYYDSTSHDRTGSGKFTLNDLETALQFCTHVIYGYVGILPNTFEVSSVNPNLDVQRRHLFEFTQLKERNPSVKFLLSIGGQIENTDKYLELLEAGTQKQQMFIQSVRDYARSYNFDGVDLAFQFPRNKPRKVHSQIGAAWKTIKKLFSGDYIVDTKSDEHKAQFTELISHLQSDLKSHDLLLSLTVPPNVNASWYFNAPAVADKVDMINLGTFDFLTPQRNPQEADFTAALYENNDQNRLPHYNVNFQVEHWTQQRVPGSKLNVGIATYGRAWKLTKDSGGDGVPVVHDTDGAAPPGPETRYAGIMNWAEICTKLPNPSNLKATGANAPIYRISDPLKRMGVYAFRAADANNEHGLWVTYDDPEFAATKGVYVKNKNLGGVFLYDITNDDFRGQCTGDKFPILRAIKFRLLS